MFDETRLDDVALLERVDGSGQLLGLARAGALARHTRTLALEAGIDRVGGGERPRSVLVAALGLSAVVAHLLEAVAEAGSPVPVLTRPAAPLPGWVGPLDLVVAVSVSGRSPGPLALAAEAGRRGASLLTVGAGDSPLADVCARARGVHVPLSAESLSSRTALWGMAIPVLLAADRLGLAPVPDGVLDAVADRLDAEAEACRPTSESFVNPAKVLATELADTLPVVLGDGPMTGVAAARAAAMLARTARVPAVHGELPDSASQVLATFGGPFGGAPQAVAGGAGADIFADPYLDGPSRMPLRLLFVRGPGGDPAADGVVARAEASGVRVSELSGEGEHALERLASVMARLDFAATYLALGMGFDPAGD